MGNIAIERTLDSGYEDKEYPIEDAIPILNNEIENGRSIWIDNKLFSEGIIQESDLVKCKKVCVTNRLIGG
jgi:hypothetical protein